MNNIYLITGASSEIGISLIKEMYNKNDIFIVHFNKNNENLIALKNELGDNIVLFQADFTNELSTDLFIQEIKEKYSNITHIIHLPAKNIKYKKFEKIKWDEFKLELDVELRSIVKIINTFIGGMSKNKNGKIVFLLTSGVINIPPKYLSNYITAKYALLGFMKSLAIEFADKNICINAVAPSMINTSFLKDVPDILIKKSESENPMKRNAEISDIIPILKMLLSDETKFITGNCIKITGGEVF